MNRNFISTKMLIKVIILIITLIGTFILYYITKDISLKKKSQFIPLLSEKNIGNHYVMLSNKYHINKFDQDIVKICGPINSNPTRISFIKILRKNKDVSDHLFIELKDLFQKNANNNNQDKQEITKEDFFNELYSIWFKNNGFKHIFCGQFSKRKLSGLHFMPRYLELERKNIGGIPTIEFLNKSKCKREFTLKYPVYLTAYAYKLYNKKNKKINTYISCRKSFAKNLSGEEIILYATKNI